MVIMMAFPKNALADKVIVEGLLSLAMTSERSDFQLSC